MPVPTHFKIVFRGVFDGSPEEWSFGTHWKRDSANANPDATISDINVGQVTAAATALIGGTEGPLFSTGVKLTEWRAYQIGTDGKMQGNPLINILGTPVSGTSGSRFPPQVALAITSVGANRGPGRFGRFYLPGPATAIGADWRLSSAQAATFLTASVNFVKAVSDAIDLVGVGASSEMLNVSVRGGPDGTKQTVDHLEVGRVYDTLRTRRAQLLEVREVGGHIDW